MSWNAEKEGKLKWLRDELAAGERERDEAIAALKSIGGSEASIGWADLIARASQVRKALEPFDLSGRAPCPAPAPPPAGFTPWVSSAYRPHPWASSPHMVPRSIEVVFRDGSIHPTDEPLQLEWQARGTAGDVIGYRVVQV